MRHARYLFAAALIASVGCRGGSNDESTRTIVSNEDHCSFDAPDGFAERRDRDALVLVGQGDQARTTIAIRSVAVDGWSEPRTPDTIIPATVTSLAALRDARVRGPVALEHPTYQAVALDVDFAPASKRGARYERRHVVLFGESRVFHVFATAPQGKLARIQDDLDRVVETLREEG